jgi:predicted nicotinamide N-methyase
MTVQYKFIDLHSGGHLWTLKQLANRDQFPTDSEKEFIGSDVWGADVPESLWPLSGILWPSGVLLAEIIANKNYEGMRILEVGCGVALASLVLKKQGHDVTASDYNSFAGELLRENAKLNNLEAPKFIKLSWQDAFLGEPYDVIIGSDVLYEPGCAQEVCQFLKSALKPAGTALFVDPGRAHVRKFETNLEAVGFRCDVEWPVRGEKTRILRIFRSS